MGIYRNGKFFAVHSDHLGAPRLVTNEANAPVWQWPYSAFGSNKPTGVLKATPKPKQVLTDQPVLLKATAATEVNLRFPGQYFDEESGLNYNYFRSYNPTSGRYSQPDPIGLGGGLSRFGYADGNSLQFTDPTGLQVAVGPGGIPIPMPVPPAGAMQIGGQGGYDPIRDQYIPGTSPSDDDSNNSCCISYTDVYEANDGKHGAVPRGNISAEPSMPNLALQNSVGVGRSKIGYDGLSGQIVMFRLTRTDHQKCIKYWHGYVVYQRDLTPEQWKAGRDAGFPNWPRKPK